MRLSTLLLVVAALHGGSRPALASRALERAESRPSPRRRARVAGHSAAGGAGVGLFGNQSR